jgi:hypothetical protein
MNLMSLDLLRQTMTGGCNQRKIGYMAGPKGGGIPYISLTLSTLQNLR